MLMNFFLLFVSDADLAIGRSVPLPAVLCCSLRLASYILRLVRLVIEVVILLWYNRTVTSLATTTTRTDYSNGGLACAILILHDLGTTVAGARIDLATAFLLIVLALRSCDSHAFALTKGAAQAAVIRTGSASGCFVDTGGAGPNLSLQALLLVWMVGAACGSILLLCIVLLHVSIVVGLWLISGSLGCH